MTILVEIDGGINAETIEMAAAEAGVDRFVAGSAVYSAEDPAAAVAALRNRPPTPRRTCGCDRSRRRGAMRRAVDQAQRVKGSTYPNPPVGRSSWMPRATSGHRRHRTRRRPARRGGRPARRGERAAGRHRRRHAGAPGNHHGRTPPCVDALLAPGGRGGVPSPIPTRRPAAERLRAAG